MWTGFIQSAKGLYGTQSLAFWARRSSGHCPQTPPTSSALLSFKPAGLKYRFWTCQPLSSYKPVPYNTSVSIYVQTPYRLCFSGEILTDRDFAIKRWSTAVTSTWKCELSLELGNGWRLGDFWGSCWRKARLP